MAPLPVRTANNVKAALERVSSPEKAKASAWFFKTKAGEYGAGDQFIGVTVPEQRKIAKQFKQLALPEISNLLQSPIHEHRLTGLFILAGQYQAGDEGAKREVVDCYVKNLDCINNWDLVDSSASYIYGDWLKTRSKTRLPSLAKSKNVWHRRIAMISCGAFIRDGDFAEALKIAKILVHDSHDLIQKAVGWMLREIGNRDRSTELAFLDQYAATMPRTMLRYAIEKFPAPLRTHYLAVPR